MPLGTEVGLGQGDFVDFGDPAPPPIKRDTAPNFRLMSIAAKRKMARGMEVGLGPGHIVLDGDPAPLPKKGTEPPIFRQSLLWPNGWMHQDATWYSNISVRAQQ